MSLTDVHASYTGRSAQQATLDWRHTIPDTISLPVPCNINNTADLSHTQ